MSMRSRFILSHLLPILVIMPLVAAALIYLLETQVLLQDLSRNLTRQAVLIATATNGRPTLWTRSAETEALLRQLSEQTGIRIAVRSRSGDLLAASDTTLPLDSPTPNLDLLTAGRRQIILTYRLDEQSATVFLPVMNVDEQLIGIIQVSDELESVANSFSRLSRYILLTLGAGLAVGVVVGLILALRLERPIGAVATAVTEIANGERTDPVPETGTKETKALARAANLLAARLRELEETRQRLLANLVHEIGRPLGALKAAVNVLREGAGEDPALREEFLAGMDGTISQMEPLLDDLARLHGQILGNISLNQRETQLTEWLPPLLLPWQAAAQEKGLVWRSDLPASLPPLTIDPDRMAQAVGNLVSNAIKYTPSGGAVMVSAGQTAGVAWIQVTDHGPGIAAEEQRQIFAPFYRSQRDRRFPQGLGLGLTIAKEVVERHHGRLTLQSTPGQGSEFTIYLPLDPAKEPPG